MTTVFEVETIFRIVNKASPAITAILRQVRELNAAIDNVRKNIAELGKGTSMPAGLTAAIGETKALAAEWANVAKNAGNARVAMGGASTRSAVPATFGGGGGGRHQPPWLRSHFTGPGAHLPGGAHVGFNGPAMAGAALLGWGVIEAAELQDAYASYLYHTGSADTPSNRNFFKNTIQRAMLEGGVTHVKEMTEAATDVVRQMKGTPTGGVDIMSEIIRAARTENLMKGGGDLKDATDAMLGLAHMTKTYDPQAIKQLFAPFAFMSVANPDSLTRMQTAASYAVPILQSGLGIDPLDSLLLGTALRRAGAANSKSGTWLARAMEGALPGTSVISKFRFGKHEKALYALGLVDKHGKPTWYGANGTPDPFKMLEIANQHLDKMPVAERMGVLQQAFGQQGARGVALLGDPAVREQFNRLKAERDSPEFRNRYANFMGTYYDRSPVQQARVALADFNVTMMNLGTVVLPAVSGGLKDLKGVLDLVRRALPGGDKTGAATTTVIQRALEGAVGGGLLGSVVPGIGTVVGAIGGGVVGGVGGVAEAYMDQTKLGQEINKTGNAAKGASDSIKQMGDAIRGFSSPSHLPPSGLYMPMNFLQGPPQSHRPTTLSLSLNVDGQTLAQAVSEQLALLYGYPTGAPASNDAARWSGGGDHSDDI